MGRECFCLGIPEEVLRNLSVCSEFSSGQLVIYPPRPVKLFLLKRTIGIRLHDHSGSFPKNASGQCLLLGYRTFQAELLRDVLTPKVSAVCPNFLVVRKNIVS